MQGKPSSVKANRLLPISVCNYYANGIILLHEVLPLCQMDLTNFDRLKNVLDFILHWQDGARRFWAQIPWGPRPPCTHVGSSEEDSDVYLHPVDKGISVDSPSRPGRPSPARRQRPSSMLWAFFSWFILPSPGRHPRFTLIRCISCPTWLLPMHRSRALLCVPDVQAAFLGEPKHPVKEVNVCCLEPSSCSFSHHPQLMPTGEGQDMVNGDLCLPA